LETVRGIIDQLKPGFLLLSDMSHLKSMDVSCAPDLGAIMELLSARGMNTVVRVIPDPRKDIGFTLISHFHFQRQVNVRTFTNLADAIKSLLTEPWVASPMDTTST
jgi:hypothetical protein